MSKAKPANVPWWAALATGITLIVIPEPATTGIGTLIVLGALGYKGAEAISTTKK